MFDAMVRGSGLFAALGALLGGIAGTFDWPLVGTLFGVAQGAAVGGATGAVVAAVLWVISRQTASWRIVRAASGALAGGMAIGGMLGYRGTVNVPESVGWTLVAVGLLSAAALGPVIAFGAGALRGGAASTARVFTRLRRILVGGAVAGLILGAISGLVIGICSYLPTAPVAAIEGAVFGVVSGVVLAVLVASVATFRLLLARR